MSSARAWRLVQSLAGVAILGALAARLGAAPFIEGLRAVRPGSMLAALVIGVATTVFSAWRWCLVARALGLALPARRAVAEYYRALFLNSVLPAGVLGDVNRAVSHGRRAGDVRRSVRAVVIERLAGQVVLAVVTAAVLIAHPGMPAAVYDLIRAHRPATGQVSAFSLAGGLVAGLIVITAAAFLFRRRISVRRRVLVRKRISVGNSGSVGNSTSVGERTSVGKRISAGDSGSARPRLGLWVAVGALSGAALLGYLTMFVIAARAAGSHTDLANLLPIVVIALLAMGLPLSVGGWGPREAVTTTAFAAVGLGASQGLTVAVVYGTLSFVACLPGAGVVLFGLVRPARATSASTRSAVTTC